MNRLLKVLIALDQLCGVLFFRDCYPDETISAYLWRRKNEKWVAVMDSIFGKDHCKDSFKNEEASAKQGVDLRGNDAAFESAASRNRGTTKLSEWTQ